jgi:nucleoside-diphosphate-sugar epimerase
LSAESCILLTGGTGLIGGELLPTLLDRPGHDIRALVRPRPNIDADSRLHDRIQRSAGANLDLPLNRLSGVSGDLTLPGLGLSADDHRAVSSSVTLIIHCAAETSFIRDECCQRINVDGMAHLIAFARQCPRKPLFVHISTATVCGAVRDMCVPEDFGCDPDGEHFNEYTRTKSVAERMLQSSGLDYLILRPSITVSAGLRDNTFANAILWFLPLLNQLDAVPMDPESRLDLVTVSYVAQAIARVIDSPDRRHNCYHLTAGREDALPLGRAARFLDRYFDREQPLELVPPHLWTRELHKQYIRTPEQRKTFAALRHYLPFLNMNVTYDSRRLRDLLGANMPVIDPFESYAGGLIELMVPQLTSGA